MGFNCTGNVQVLRSLLQVGIFPLGISGNSGPPPVHEKPDAIRDSLYRQVFNPVRWQAGVERLIAEGCDLFWEVGPNRVLTGLMRKIDRKTKTINISSVDRLAAAKE